MARTPLVWPTISSDQTIGGITYRINNGKVYELPSLNELSTLYDPNFIHDNYVSDDGTVNTPVYISSDGVEYLVFRSMYDSFANGAHVRDLIGATRNWTSMALDSPLAPQGSAATAIKNAVLAGTSDFLDNRVDIGAGRTSGGPGLYRATARQVSRLVSPRIRTTTGAIRCFAVPPAVDQVTSKASLDSEKYFFKKGDAVRIVAYFKIESGVPTTLMDLESSYIANSPGLRVFLNTLAPKIQLKWGDNPNFAQSGGPVSFQYGVWAKLEVYYKLDDTSAGKVQLLLNDVLLVNASGQTLPTPDTVYTRLQIGATANSSSSNCVVYVDDLAIDLVADR